MLHVRFVKTSGKKFTLGGSTYVLVGENAYWLAQQATEADIDTAFADIAATGATTVRTWGFNEVTSASGTYYQIWSGSTPTVNYGADGLQRFDYVVSSAKAHGLVSSVPAMLIGLLIASQRNSSLL